MPFLSCPDVVLRNINKTAWNRVIQTMKKLRTAIPVARSVRIIVEALMDGVNPIAPPFTKDK